jgi:hypothetical protein
MTDRDQLGMTPRNHLLEATRKELVEFERREIEFRKKDREERAAELGLPLELIKLHYHRGRETEATSFNGAYPHRRSSSQLV